MDMGLGFNSSAEFDPDWRDQDELRLRPVQLFIFFFPDRRLHLEMVKIVASSSVLGGWPGAFVLNEPLVEI
jgi:hypothetical protein